MIQVVSHDVERSEPGRSNKSEVTNALRAILESVAEEVIVVDETEAQQQQYRLRTMAIELGKGAEPVDAWPRWRGELQRELKIYKQQAEKRVKGLRSDLKNTAEALQTYVVTFSDGGTSHEKRLQSDLAALEQVGKRDTVPELQEGVAQVAQQLAATIEGITKQNQLVVTQLRDEIRTLQRSLEQAERRGRQTANISQRGTFERRVQERIERGDEFCLFLVRIPNWGQILSKETADRASVLINEVHSKMNESLGADTFAGRWYDGYLVALVPLERRAAMDASDELVRVLSGGYPVPDGDHTRTVNVSVRIAVLDHFHGQTAQHLLNRVDQLIKAFEQR